jgi:hypothetical protein
MLLADTDYPFLDILWTMIIFFAWVAWIWIAVTVFADVFRRHDISGWGKAAWCLFVIVLPFLGVFVYLIANGKHMAERNENAQRAAKSQFDDYVKTVAADQGPAGQIEKAKELLDSGAISQSEFDTLKAKALGSGGPAPALA